MGNTQKKNQTAPVCITLSQRFGVPGKRESGCCSHDPEATIRCRAMQWTYTNPIIELERRGLTSASLMATIEQINKESLQCFSANYNPMHPNFCRFSLSLALFGILMLIMAAIVPPSVSSTFVAIGLPCVLVGIWVVPIALAFIHDRKYKSAQKVVIRWLNQKIHRQLNPYWGQFGIQWNVKAKREGGGQEATWFYHIEVSLMQPQNAVLVPIAVPTKRLEIEGERPIQPGSGNENLQSPVHPLSSS